MSQAGNLYVLRAKSAPRVMALGSSVFFIQRWLDGKIAVGLGSGALVFFDDAMQELDRVSVGQKSLRCCMGDRGLVGGSEGCIWQLNAEGAVIQRFEALDFRSLFGQDVMCKCSRKSVPFSPMALYKASLAHQNNSRISSEGLGPRACCSC